MINLENLRKEHDRIKRGIANGEIKVIEYGSASEFLKSIEAIIRDGKEND